MALNRNNRLRCSAVRRAIYFETNQLLSAGLKFRTDHHSKFLTRPIFTRLNSRRAGL
jgi:hypothetical protein